MQSKLSQISHVTDKLINNKLNEWLSFTYRKTNQHIYTPLKQLHLSLRSLTCAHNKYTSLYKHTSLHAHKHTHSRWSPWIGVFWNWSLYVCFSWHSIAESYQFSSSWYSIQFQLQSARFKGITPYHTWTEPSEIPFAKNEMKHQDC